MSSSLQLPFELVLLLFPLFLLLLSFQLAFSRKTKLPPSPPKLPFIGNLHQLGPLRHRSLQALAEKHGPLMLLHLGQVPTLVVSSAEMAREIMKAHDLIFSSRPFVKANNNVFNGKVGLAFAPYGEHWKQMRKICTLHLLGAKKVQSYRLAREEEVAFMIRRISQSSRLPDPINLSEIFFSFTCDMICRVVSGKSFREGGRNNLFRKVTEEDMALLMGFHVEDFFPSLAWLDRLFFGTTARAKRNAERWDNLVDDVIKDHADQMKGDDDFVDILLSLQKDPTLGFPLSNNQIKAILMDMFGAGTETTSVSLEWAMAELARNSRVMMKLKDEVRGLAMGKGFLKDEDLSAMSYLKAVTKEVLRLHPPAPLLLPRESMDDCNIQGYEIPKRARVIINAWAIHRDPKSWEAPEEFRPERFMADKIDFNGNDFQFIPFGAGRRICLGMNFAVSNLELALANLVNCFDWELPYNMTQEDLDMTDAIGLSAARNQKLHLVAKPCACNEIVNGK